MCLRSRRVFGGRGGLRGNELLERPAIKTHETAAAVNREDGDDEEGGAC